MSRAAVFLILIWGFFGLPALAGDLSGLARVDPGESRIADTRHGADLVLSLSQGVPGVTDVASQLGMSGRTLQRQLADRGATFQKLVDQARRELAERLLADTSYPLAEVAFLTGFSEQSAFNRAFKRWAGQTPRSFRLKA